MGRCLSTIVHFSWPITSPGKMVMGMKRRVQAQLFRYTAGALTTARAACRGRAKLCWMRASCADWERKGAAVEYDFEPIVDPAFVRLGNPKECR
jgi:hypothetical protein